MPKSRSRKKARASGHGGLAWGGTATKGSGRINLVLGAVGVLAVLAGGFLWWHQNSLESEFLALAKAGAPALARVENRPNLGGGHLQPGQSHSYGEPVPTSGIHAPSWTQAGFYQQVQSAIELVHALEHGNIVIYYDKPGAEALATLKDWTGLYDGQWDGLVVVPGPALGQTLVLSAWTKLLTLGHFDAAAAAAFIDAYRGRGPENPVR